MEYKIKHQSGLILLTVILVGILLVCPALIVLFYYLDLNYLAIFTPLVMCFVPLLVGVKLATYYTKIVLTDDSLFINEHEIKIADIQSYYLRYLTPRVEVIDISLSSGKEISITGFNFGPYGDAMKQVKQTLIQVFEKNDSFIANVESNAAKKIKLYRRRWKRFIYGLTIVVGIIDVGFIGLYFCDVVSGKNLIVTLSFNLIIPSLLGFANKIDSDGEMK